MTSSALANRDACSARSDIDGAKQTFRGTVNNLGEPPRPAAATPETCTYGPDHYGPGTDHPNNQGETLCPHVHGGSCTRARA